MGTAKLSTAAGVQRLRKQKRDPRGRFEKKMKISHQPRSSQKKGEDAVTRKTSVKTTTGVKVVSFKPPRKCTYKAVRTPQGDSDGYFEVEDVLDVAVNMKTGERTYLVKWVGYPEDESTWEPICNFTSGGRAMVEAWEKSREMREKSSDSVLRQSMRHILGDMTVQNKSFQDFVLFELESPSTPFKKAAVKFTEFTQVPFIDGIDSESNESPTTVSSITCRSGTSTSGGGSDRRARKRG